MLVRAYIFDKTNTNPGHRVIFPHVETDLELLDANTVRVHYVCYDLSNLPLTPP